MLIRKGGLWPPSAFLETIMTKQPNDTAPDLIVLGPEEGQPRAARFPADQADLVAKAAKAMNLTVCKADSAVRLADLAKKLPDGRLYATGRASCRRCGAICTATSSNN